MNEKKTEQNLVRTLEQRESMAAKILSQMEYDIHVDHLTKSTGFLRAVHGLDQFHGRKVTNQEIIDLLCFEDSSFKNSLSYLLDAFTGDHLNLLVVDLYKVDDGRWLVVDRGRSIPEHAAEILKAMECVGEQIDVASKRFLRDVIDAAIKVRELKPHFNLLSDLQSADDLSSDELRWTRAVIHAFINPEDDELRGVMTEGADVQDVEEVLSALHDVHTGFYGSDQEVESLRQEMIAEREKEAYELENEM